MTPKEKYQFQRELSKIGLKVLRNWEDVGKCRRAVWQHGSDDEAFPARLYIHEDFAPAAWRLRDGGKEIQFVYINGRPYSLMIAIC
jgi:hypothetical protein